jgi:putative heme iron utilization protein
MRLGLTIQNIEKDGEKIFVVLLATACVMLLLSNLFPQVNIKKSYVNNFSQMGGHLEMENMQRLSNSY